MIGNVKVFSIFYYIFHLIFSFVVGLLWLTLSNLILVKAIPFKRETPFTEVRTYPQINAHLDFRDTSMPSGIPFIFELTTGHEGF